jgi:DNA-binding response OmpR family regulator
MNVQVLLVADTTQRRFATLRQELATRGFGLICCRNLAEMRGRILAPEEFCGLVLVDGDAPDLNVYEFCRTWGERFGSASLVLMVEKIETSVRSYALRQGAADVLAVGATQAHLIAEKLEALLQRCTQATATGALDPDPSEPPAGGVPVEMVLAGLRQLARVAEAHFSRFVVVNYWQATRADLPELAFCLEQFAVAYNSELAFKSPRQTLSPREVIAVRRWVAAFIGRCQQAVEEFPNLAAEFAAFAEMSQAAQAVRATVGDAVYQELGVSCRVGLH